MLKYADFQSAIQLAAALNAGYAATVSLIGRTLRDEIQYVNEMIEANSKEISAAQNNNSTSRTPIHSTAKELQRINIEFMALQGDMHEEERDFVTSQEGALRVLSIAVCLFAIVMLFLSTFLKDLEAGPVFQNTVLALYVPFFMGVILCSRLIMNVKFSFRTRRIALESDLEAHSPS